VPKPMPSIGKGAQLQIRGMWSAGPGDDQARFLADLRSLRDTAAIGYDELAARAHFPSDILKEAENGPVLPGLPILTAYVRACEGDVTEWEERWRRLAAEIPEDPDLPVRPAGASPAAAAGARAGVGIAPPDVYDPERIRAALRGGHERSDRGSRRASGAGWDTPADQTIKTANGNHVVDSWSADAVDSWSAEPSDAVDSWSAKPSDAVDSWSAEPSEAAAWPDPAKSAEPTGQFHWQPDHGSAAGPADQGQTDTGQTDTGQTDTGQTGTRRADWWADNGRNGDGQVAAAADVAPAEPTAGEWTSRHRDGAPKPPERTDFWVTQNTAASADLQLPATASHGVEEQNLTQPSWSTPTAASSAASAASQHSQQAATNAAPSAGSATAAPGASTVSAGSAGYTRSANAGSARPAAGKTTAGERDDHQKDQFFTVVRLLVIIVIAALIGSALVLLLK